MRSTTAAASSSAELAKKPFLRTILTKAAERLGNKQIWRIATKLEALAPTAPADAVREALRHLSIFLSDEDFASLCASYRPDGAAAASPAAAAPLIDTAALLQSLLTTPLSPRRRYAVDLVLRKLDPNNTGSVAYVTLSDEYDVMRHPDVRSGARTEDDVLLDFFDTFCAADGAPMEQLTAAELRLYCVGISMPIKDDTEFELWCTRAFCLDRPKVRHEEETARLLGSRTHSRQSRLLGEGRQHPLFTTTSEEYGKEATSADYKPPKYGRPPEFTRTITGRTGGATSMNM